MAGICVHRGCNEIRTDTLHIETHQGQRLGLTALEMLQVLWEKGRELEGMKGKCDGEGNGWGRMEKEGQADPVVCLGYDSHDGNKTSLSLGWSPCL